MCEHFVFCVGCYPTVIFTLCSDPPFRGILSKNCAFLIESIPNILNNGCGTNIDPSFCAKLHDMKSRCTLGIFHCFISFRGEIDVFEAGSIRF